MILRRWIVTLILLATIPNTTSEWDGIDEDEEETEQREDAESKIEKAVMQSTALTTTTIPTTTKDFCHCEMEIYGPEVLEGVLKSPNYPSLHCETGKCIYNILPHPNMSLHINVESILLYGLSTLRYWNIINVEKKEYLIYNSLSTGQHADEYFSQFKGYNMFTTAVNVGFKVVFKMQHNEYDGYSSRGFKIKFERVSSDDKKYLCPPSQVTIGPESTEVSVGNQTFLSRSGCMFFLTRSSEGIENGLEEMYINITTEGGVSVDVGSYDENGVLTSRDSAEFTRGVFVDATRVEVVFRARPFDEGPYNTPRITAMLMSKTCKCPEPEYVLTFQLFSITITSPGFPDLYCPGKKCNTLIKVPKIKGEEKKKTDLIFVETNCSLSELDLLQLKSDENSKILFRYTTQSGMKIIYTESEIKNCNAKYIGSQLAGCWRDGIHKLPECWPHVVDHDGTYCQSWIDLVFVLFANQKMDSYFLANLIYKFALFAECVCSVYDSKVFETNGKLTIPISSRCHLMHCHWKFSNNRYDTLISVSFKLENPYKTDLIYMYSDHMMEEYGYGELSHVRQVTSPSAISMTFSRMKWFKTPNATLKISWEQVERCVCPDESFHLTEGTSLVITSPHWPQQYCSMLLCRHTFFAPKGHFLEVVIDNADIERYHDYLKIYDGNSTTDPLLMKVSGLSEKVIQFNSTQNTVMFVFKTDESGLKKGYHANVICHAYPSTSKGSFVFIIVLLALVVAIVSVGAAFVIHRKKAQNNRQYQSMNNPTVSYSASGTGSATLNVAFEPGNNESVNTTELETQLL